jgi:uncharacterized protein DUF3108/tetratricopeptide repeat protein
MKSRVLLSALLAGVLAACPMAVAQSASDLLEKGIYTEETVGDLDAAIEIYRKIVDQAKANRTFSAKALYRLGSCLLKQDKKAQAEEAFNTLIEQYPDQKRLVAKARKQVSGGGPESDMGPVPWKDGEVIQMAMRLQGGLEIGAFTLSANAAEVDGKKVWRLETRRYVTISPSRGISHVDADWETFRPLRSEFKHTLLGDVTAVYEADKVKTTTRKDGKVVKESEVELAGFVCDNEQAMHLMRRLPLAEGYKTTLPVYASFGGGKVGIEIEVVAKETVATPAGEFECYKIHMSPVEQDFWYSTDANRYLVKFEATGVVSELASVTQRKAGEPIAYHDAETGVSIKAPAGWYFHKQKQPSEENCKALVFMIDPLVASKSVIVVKDASKAKPEQIASARAWAEHDIEEAKKAYKDYKVRPGSWKTRTWAGQPAVSVLVDYLDGEKKMVEYYTAAIKGSKSLDMSLHVEADLLDDLQPDFDSILNSVEVK